MRVLTHIGRSPMKLAAQRLLPRNARQNARSALASRRCAANAGVPASRASCPCHGSERKTLLARVGLRKLREELGDARNDDVKVALPLLLRRRARVADAGGLG